MIPGSELVRRLSEPDPDFIVTPLINPERQIGQASIDIRLGPDIIVSRRATGATAFDAADGEGFREAVRQRQQYVRRGLGAPFHLQPGEFVIARSLEYLALPNDISGEALGRSSLGRLGLVIATATMIDPGFRGTITLELTNLGNTPLVLEVGLAIAQVVFRRDPAKLEIESPGTGHRKETSREEEADSSTLAHRHDLAERWWGLRASKESRYTGQVKPEASRLDQEDDLRWIPHMAVKYVVGVVGERFSGKSTVVNFLVARRQFRLYRLSQFVYEEARRRGVDPTDRNKLREVGKDLRERHGEDVLARMAFFRMRRDYLDPDRSRAPTAIVVGGFRTAAEVAAWQELDIYRSLVITAPPGERLRRATAAEMITSQDTELPRPEPRPDAEGPSDDELSWFTSNVDTRVTESGVLEQARSKDVRTPHIDIYNDGSSVPDLHTNLKLQVRRLERWWRARVF